MCCTFIGLETRTCIQRRFLYLYHQSNKKISISMSFSCFLTCFKRPDWAHFNHIFLTSRIRAAAVVWLLNENCSQVSRPLLAEFLNNWNWWKKRDWLEIVTFNSSFFFYSAFWHVEIADTAELNRTPVLFCLNYVWSCIFRSKEPEYVSRHLFPYYKHV